MIKSPTDEANGYKGDKTVIMTVPLRLAVHVTVKEVNDGTFEAKIFSLSVC